MQCISNLVCFHNNPVFFALHRCVVFWKKSFGKFHFDFCSHEPKLKFFSFCLFTETPLWLLLQVAPIRNERDLVVLLLLTFRDITAFKQIIDAEDTKSGNLAFGENSSRIYSKCRNFFNFCSRPFFVVGFLKYI